MKQGLDYFFTPKGCAVIGASSNPGKAGFQILKNIVDFGYPGHIAPINPTEKMIFDLPAYKTISDVPHPVELVVYSAPSQATGVVVSALEARMRNKGDIKALICAASGFAETHTDQGKQLQDILAGFCKNNNIRMLGPNCVGLADMHNRINATFVDMPQKSGGISIVSQSGAVGACVLYDWMAAPAPVGFNKFVSVGNMADIDIIEALDYAGGDKKTTVLGIYLEGVPQARKLVETCGKIAKEKPVVLLKVGRTEAGARAAASHTGSLAGTDTLYTGALRQHNVCRVSTQEELTDTLRAFDNLPLPAGNKPFILTQAGGPGIICVDAMAQAGCFQTPFVSDKTKKQLKELLPDFASVCEPEGHADITAAATAQQHVNAMETVLSDPEVDGVFFITVATCFLDLKALADKLIQMLTRLKTKGVDKPIFPVFLSDPIMRESREILENSGLPTYTGPNQAVQAFGHLTKYAKNRNQGE